VALQMMVLDAALSSEQKRNQMQVQDIAVAADSAPCSMAELYPNFGRHKQCSLEQDHGSVMLQYLNKNLLEGTVTKFHVIWLPHCHSIHKRWQAFTVAQSLEESNRLL
jgi:hypothetical protein